jgi:hypothetical protein
MPVGPASRRHAKRKKPGRRFRRSTCASTRKRAGTTCYTTEALLSLRDGWNTRHPDAVIRSENPRGIWDELKSNMKGVCDTERCWLRQQFARGKLGAELLATTFAPQAPESWRKNPKEWLTSLDIERVMKQWERRYPEFVFIGPSPIDFDKVVDGGECVWNELCKFSLRKLMARGKTKIGIVFNLDPHYKPGSHWVTMFIDVPRKFVLYFDSAGDGVPAQVRTFGKRVVAQAADLGIRMEMVDNRGVRHQRGNTECGIYALYAITELLSGRKELTHFLRGRIPDGDMLSLRSVYFDVQ